MLLSCSACNKLGLSRTGFWSHLVQSRNPACQALYTRLTSSTAPTPGTSSSIPASPGTESPIETPIAFQGDMFGSAAEYEGEGDDIFEEEAFLEERRIELELENGWEAPRPEAPAQPSHTAAPSPQTVPSDDEGEPDPQNVPHLPRRISIPPPDGSFIEKYSDRHPQSQPGKVLQRNDNGDTGYCARLPAASGSGPWAPFSLKIDWEFVRWANLRGPGSTAFSELLAIEGVAEALGLSYRSTQELNKIVDHALPSWPQFHRSEVVVAGEEFELYLRDIIECIRALWGDPEFLPFLIFEPERHYMDQDKTLRVVHNMHTGKWWWATHEEVQQFTKMTDITIVPIIISSDKTQLAVFGNKTAYLVTKHIVSTTAYLPTSKLEHIENKMGRRRALANLFHACLDYILEPLREAGIQGLELQSGDGVVRRGFPIVAAYVGDYPEQLLVTCLKNGRCPRCPVDPLELGNPAAVKNTRDLEPILNALNSAGIKPVPDPFWHHLPFLNIYQSITPDLLHQLYQGVLKALIGWVHTICGSSEIDARCRRLPPNHNIRLFLKGISHLSRVTGAEHDQISRILLGIVVDIQLPDGYSSVRLVKAVRGLLDFLTLARYPIHSSITFDEMDAALAQFHENKGIFIDLGVQTGFNIPKLHFLSHYRRLFESFGTADNFNTEYTERLHINYTKEAYRASNHKDEYPQMTTWLNQRERILLHEKYLHRKVALEATSETATPTLPCPIPPISHPRTMKMAKTPNTYGVTFDDLASDYGVTDIRHVLSRFVVAFRDASLTKQAVCTAAEQLHLPFSKLSIYYRINVHAEPAKADKYGKLIPGRFDTALVRRSSNLTGEDTLKGYCISQVRCIFKLPAAAGSLFTGSQKPPTYLAFVDYIGRSHGLYKVSRYMVNGIPQSRVIPVNQIEFSVHLFPQFGPVAPAHWKSSNVLASATHFYVNPFSDRLQYLKFA
ncbi:hypothetical protein FA13DRAFT_1751781 [Coprinellus micaceus]|uniref:Uncharacterized protein n=1 Tax=Coprinellus micaceus TaxID=71717 RepID=A0A4Y7TU78_COPMI|nr:hypothetical protein FA13DRAFT_1751781 [Coprinellus micaceus]